MATHAVIHTYLPSINIEAVYIFRYLHASDYFYSHIDVCECQTGNSVLTTPLGEIAIIPRHIQHTFIATYMDHVCCAHSLAHAHPYQSSVAWWPPFESECFHETYVLCSDTRAHIPFPHSVNSIRFSTTWFVMYCVKKILDMHMYLSGGYIVSQLKISWYPSLLGRINSFFFYHVCTCFVVPSSSVCLFRFTHDCTYTRCGVATLWRCRFPHSHDCKSVIYALPKSAQMTAIGLIITPFRLIGLRTKIPDPSISSCVRVDACCCRTRSQMLLFIDCDPS